MNVAIEKIVDITGLTKDEIKKQKMKINNLQIKNYLYFYRDNKMKNKKIK